MFVITSPKPVNIIQNRMSYKRKQIKMDLNHSIELTGKVIGSFVLIYTSLNWAMYRRIRLHSEAEEKKKNDKK